VSCRWSVRELKPRARATSLSQAHIHEDGRLCARTQQERELNGAFVPRAGQPDFFRTGQLFVASDALDGVQERLAVQSGNGLRRAAINGKIRPERQAAENFVHAVVGAGKPLDGKVGCPRSAPRNGERCQTRRGALCRVGSGSHRIHAINLTGERDGLHQPNPVALNGSVASFGRFLHHSS
jgi:hypothetical protein